MTAKNEDADIEIPSSTESVSAVCNGISGLVNTGRLFLDASSSLVWIRDRGVWRFLPGVKFLRIHKHEVDEMGLNHSSFWGDSIDLRLKDGSRYSFTVGSTGYLTLKETLALLPINLAWDNSADASKWYRRLHDWLISG